MPGPASSCAGSNSKNVHKPINSTQTPVKCAYLRAHFFHIYNRDTTGETRKKKSNGKREGGNNMKRMQKVACVLWLAGLSCLMAAILTSWNDKAFLPLALTFIMAANYSGIACEKLQKGKAAE